MSLFVELLAADKRLRDLAMIASAGAVVLLYVALGDGGFPLDDSWIHQVYARSLGERGEWAFIPGQPSGASTAPLYTVLLSIGYTLGLPPMLWTHLLGWVALGGAGLIAVRMADYIAPGRLATGWFTGWAVVLAWHLIWASASGMETMLFSTLVLLMMLQAWRTGWQDAAVGVRQGVIFGLLTAALVATRPEGALVAGLAALLLLYAGGPTAAMRRKAMRRMAAAAGLTFVLALLPYLLLNTSLNGSPLPNTSAAKQAQHAPILALPFGERVLDMSLPILVGAQIFLLPGMIIVTVGALLRAARGERRALLLTLPVAWGAGLVLLYAARLPASYQHGRYVIPALPGLLVVGVVGVNRFVAAWRPVPVARIVPLTLAFSAALVTVYFGLFQGPGIYRTDQRIINDEMVGLAKWLRDNVPETDLLAVHDIGAVGYFAPRPILDIAGLVTPEVVGLIGDPDALWDLMRQRGAAYLMAFPDQIPNQNPDDPRLCWHYETDGTGSTDVGGPKMTIYRLDWDESCEDS